LLSLPTYIIAFLISATFPVGKKEKNLIGTKLIFGRFGLPCLPAGRRLRSSVPISKETKATGAIAHIHIAFLLSVTFLEGRRNKSIIGTYIMIGRFALPHYGDTSVSLAVAGRPTRGRSPVPKGK